MKRKLLSLVFTVALLVGMMSVMGTFPFGATAEEVTKFTANFAELNNSGSFTGSSAKLVIEYNDPATDTSATNVANHNWLSTRFDSYTNFHNIIQRGYFSQGDEDGGSRFVYGALSALGGMADAYRGLMFDNASPGGELFWSINTLVPHYDGETVTVKNFEATVKFAMTNNLSGGLLFAFHESAAGQYTFADSYTARQNTGSVLAIGNSVDTKASYGGSGSSTDAWKFYADGKVEANYMTNVDKNFGVNLNSQWYTLTVKAVNGTVTFTLVSEDGTVNETMTKAYSSTSGNVSLGFSGREVMLREVTLVELDSEGTPVDIGTYADAAHTCEFATPKYDEAGHWNECECGEKDEVKAHTFVDGECSCGALQMNVAVLNAETNEITVRTDAGYELKAGSLVVTDSEGNKFIPTRVGFREGGNADAYVVNDPSFNAEGATVQYEFIEATLDNPNIGNIGTSVNTDLTGLRFISRFTRQVIDGTEYVVLADGTKYVITDYGVLLAAAPGLATTDASNEEDMVVDSANLYVKQFSAVQLDRHYDICDDHIDISACIINIDKVLGYTAKDMELYARAYVIVDVNGTETALYGDVATSTYYDNMANTATLSELCEDNTVLIDGRHTITDAGNVQVSFGNAGITIAGDLAGDIYVDVQYTKYSYGECRINVMVDGTYVDDVIAVYGDNHLKVVSGLEGGYHTVKISKGAGTPSLGDLVFKNVTYNGNLETPKVNDLQFMFLGDSITDTAGILGAYSDAPDAAGVQLPSQNIRLGYAALTSQALGADFTQVSFAGKTIPEMVYIFEEEAFPNGTAFAPYEYGTNDTTEKDVVVINLGTNVSTDMHNDVKACLSTVRAKHPNAYIVWTYGMMFTANDSVLSTAVTEWVNETGDTKTSYCSLTSAANTDGGAQHPLAFAHKNAADILTAHIANVLNIDVE